MNESPVSKQVRKYAVFGIFFLSSFHFLLLLFGIILQALQMDFSSLYMAGAALNHGQNPYANQLSRDPALWDGFSPFEASKFLYPPLAALIFQGLALFSYLTAKEIWTVSIIWCVIFSVVLHAKTVGYELTRQTWLLIIGLIFLFFPFIAELECGQVDALCLLFISVAIYFQLRPKRWPFVAGIFVALASLFKLHCGLIIFYLLLKRQFKMALGFAAGWVLLGLCSIAIYGWQAQKDYLLVDMPRISKYACYGDEDMRINPLVLGIAQHGTSVGNSRIQGTEYVSFGLDFSPFSGIPYYLKVLLQSKFTFGTWAMVVAFFFFVLVLYHRLKVDVGNRQKEGVLSEYIFWQIILLAVLLSGPLTWIMNSVWLVPLIPLCFHLYSKTKTRRAAVGWTLLVVGLIVIGFPDESAGTHTIDLSYLFLIFKPIVGELLCFTGLLRIHFALRMENSEATKAAKPSLAADGSMLS